MQKISKITINNLTFESILQNFQYQMQAIIIEFTVSAGRNNLSQVS